MGVLTRENAHAELVFDALTQAGVPVEIVGLSGLLRLPEIAEVVAVLRLLHDVTDNAALLTLLAGPRWGIGARDLRLLGQRAGEPGRTAWAGRGCGLGQRAGWSRSPMASTRPRSPVSTTPWRTRARRRTPPRPGSASPCSATSLRHLRAAVGEPLLDLVRRIVDVTGVDVEPGLRGQPGCGSPA
ncbi:3'-5' exonuclease [Nocardioides convexus]|uniref:3'-5' exonuclease n=1 Tax=Nocardioides convexus TaxID=2712224 RepID=UPI00241892C0|nr:3'-5' exonuclease [Nocardioides convexus]